MVKEVYLLANDSQALSILADWAMVAIGLGSVLVAAVAVWVALRQAKASDRHYRLSVKPRMHSHIHADSGSTLRVSIMNNGLGPADLKCIQYGFRGGQLRLWNQWEFVEFIDKDLGFGIATFLAEEPEWLDFQFPFAIKPGEKLDIFVIRSKGPAVADMNTLMDLMREKLEILIEYESFYGESFTMREPQPLGSDLE